MEPTEWCDCRSCTSHRKYTPTHNNENTRDVSCAKCKELFHREWEDTMKQGQRCDCTLYEQKKSGYDGEIGSGVSFETAEKGTILIVCGYGSRYDGHTFRFGRKKGLCLDQCPEWVKESLGKNVCDFCMKGLLAEGSIRSVCYSFAGEEFDYVVDPCLCDCCDKPIEDVRYLVSEHAEPANQAQYDDPNFRQKMYLVILDREENQKDEKDNSPWCEGHYGTYKFNESPPEWAKCKNVICSSCFELALPNLTKEPLEVCIIEYMDPEEPQQTQEFLY